MKIATIIPVYNRPATVFEAMESVAAQTRPPDRLAIVDDGSTTNMTASLEAWIARAQPSFEVTVIRQPNKGASAARNRGIEINADVDFFAFLDSDDLWPHDFLNRALSRLIAHPDAVAASSDRQRICATTGTTTRQKLTKIQDEPTRWLFKHGAGIASSSLFRAAPIRDLGGFDETLPTGHDTHLFLRLSLLGKWLHIPGDPVMFRRGVTQSRDEHDHLRFTYSDFHHRWAMIYEDFLQSCSGRHTLSARFCRSSMVKRWRTAARQHEAHGRVVEARECQCRADHWQASGWSRGMRLARELYRALRTRVTPTRLSRL